MADLEQAIGENAVPCSGHTRRWSTPPKWPGSSKRWARSESPDDKQKAAGGPGEAAADSSSQGSMPPPRKRLFQIREGAMWMGVCNGIAAYLNVDVTWVRIAFVLGTIFSSGIGFLVYLVLMFVVPGGEHSGRSRRRLRHALQQPKSSSAAQKKTLRSSGSSTAGGASGAASSGTGIGSSAT